MTGSTAPTVSAPTPTFGDQLLSDIKSAGAQAVLAALQVYGGIIAAGLNSLSQVPSVSELGAVGLQIEANIIAAFPQLEQAEIQVLATNAKVAFTQLQTYLTTQATTASAS